MDSFLDSIPAAGWGALGPIAVAIVAWFANRTAKRAAAEEHEASAEHQATQSSVLMIRTLREELEREQAQRAKLRSDLAKERVERRHCTDDNQFLRRRNLTLEERLRELGVDPAEIVPPPLRDDG